MNAWLLTWEGTSGPAILANKKIVAIISARRASSTIEKMVDLLYCRSVDSAYDMAFMAYKGKQRAGQYKLLCSTPGRIFYGRNPCIYARVVSNLRIERDETRKEERVQWTEPPYRQFVQPGYVLVEVEPPYEQELVRALEPLSLDVYGRKS